MRTLFFLLMLCYAQGATAQRIFVPNSATEVSLISPLTDVEMTVNTMLSEPEYEGISYSFVNLIATLQGGDPSNFGNLALTPWLSAEYSGAKEDAHGIAVFQTPASSAGALVKAIRQSALNNRLKEPFTEEGLCRAIFEGDGDLASLKPTAKTIWTEVEHRPWPGVEIISIKKSVQAEPEAKVNVQKQSPYSIRAFNFGLGFEYAFDYRYYSENFTKLKVNKMGIHIPFRVNIFNQGPVGLEFQPKLGVGLFQIEKDDYGNGVYFKGSADLGIRFTSSRHFGITPYIGGSADYVEWDERNHLVVADTYDVIYSLYYGVRANITQHIQIWGEFAHLNYPKFEDEIFEHKGILNVGLTIFFLGL